MTDKSKIIEHPNRLLRSSSEAITEFDHDLDKLIQRLKATLGSSLQPGIGLAAVQIGKPKRVVLADVAGDEPSGGVLEMVNPKIINKSDVQATFVEGCLSMPEVWLSITRPQVVTVGYYTPKGAEREITLTDYCSAVVQHEMDHMDGKLIIDHVSPLKRKMALTKMKKVQRSEKHNA